MSRVKLAILLAVKAKRTEDILMESLEEHLSLKRLLADLMEMTPGDAAFEAKFKVLREQTEHHHEEEEENLFPKVRKLLDEDQLAALGREMMAFQVTMHTQGEPAEEMAGQTDKAARLARVNAYLAADRFCVTYGDGVSDIDLHALLEFHCAHGKPATITAVQPKHYQYGTMEAGEDGLVREYIQYPELPYWINAGFMVFERRALDWMQGGDEVALETGVLQEMIAAGELMMYRHDGFWQSMDTLKDANELERLWQSGAPWKVW